MLVARPIEAFRIGDRRVLACHVADAAATRFLGGEFTLYREGRQLARIRIEGLSTASPTGESVFDFSYSGDEIAPDQVGEGSLLTDGRYEEALREAAVA